MITLYDFANSGASYRARIALNLKELDYQQVPIHLTKAGGEQFSSDYTELNPQNFVPTLVDGDIQLIQSMAIMEYLEEVYPNPSIIPGNSVERAEIRSLSNIIACDIHPINNLRVRLYLDENMAVTPENQKLWIEHWIRNGFNAYMKLYDKGPQGKFSYGDNPTIADACLIPQIANARRNGCDLSDYDILLKIEDSCQALPAFERALPANQPS
jgi:maleylacetoacetate isomerase